MPPRLKCANGHALDGQLRGLATKSGCCPTCGAGLLVWAKITCNDGHRLKLWAKPTGGKVNCPECGQKVVVLPFDLKSVAGTSREPSPPPPRVSDSSTVLYFEDVAALTRQSDKRSPRSNDLSYEYRPPDEFDPSTIYTRCRLCGAHRDVAARFCSTCGQRA